MDIPKTTIRKILDHCKHTRLRYIIGALIGILAAAGLITVTGCTLTIEPDALRYIITNPIDPTGK